MWLTRGKMHFYLRQARHVRRHRELWIPPEFDPSLGEVETEELYQLFSRIGLIKHPYISVFQVRSVIANANVF
jgi:hypothetical protein